MISVCLATYNGEKYIREQLLSILEQLSEIDEIIISDDSSTDSTVDIIQKMNDNRIKLILNNKFYSPSLNFENALKHASGEYIFLSDQDDVWVSDKIIRMMKYLKEYDLVVSNAYITDEFLNVISHSAFEVFNSRSGIIKNIYVNTYYGCCMAFNKKILQASFPFPKNKEVGHDLWLGLVAESIGKVHFLDEQLIYFRRHSSTVTMGGKGKSRRSFVKKLQGRMIILKDLFKFYFKLKVMR